MVTSLTGPVLAEYQDLYSSSATPGGPSGGLVLGAKAYAGDGREFRFCLAGATTLAQGKLQQSAAQVTTNQNIAVQAAAAKGATSVSVTLGATAATLNEFANGWLATSDGYQYSIKGNPAANASATLTLTLDDPLQAAITTATTASLIPNTYANVIVAPTTATGNVVGAAVFPVVAAQYGWVQVAGPASVLSGASITVGEQVVPSTTTAGEVIASASYTAQVVGTAAQTLSSGDYGIVNLTIG